MLRRIITFFCLFVGFTLFAQVGGESTYQFLNLISSPRQAALGGKVFTNVDYDVTQGLFNPATINADMDRQLALNYTSYLGGINYGTAAYARKFGEKNKIFHAGITYINYGAFDGRDEDGNQTGDFSGNETAISLGYAGQIGASSFYYGANAKLITSKLEQYTSFGVATDLSLLHKNESSGLVASLVFRNIGTQVTTYADVREKLPFEIALGISQRLEHVPIRWHLTLENLQKWPIATPNPARETSDLDGNKKTTEKIGFFAEAIRHTIIAAELFPEKGFNIRLGYNFRKGQELLIADQRNFSGFSAGFSIRIKKIRFSYTHAKYTSASNPNFFGMQIDLQ